MVVGCIVQSRNLLRVKTILWRLETVEVATVRTILPRDDHYTCKRPRAAPASRAERSDKFCASGEPGASMRPQVLQRSSNRGKEVIA